MNLSEQYLAYSSGYSKGYVSKIFLQTVPILKNAFAKLIFWPSKRNIQKNLPIFRHRFKNVQSIIDALEIQIKKPSNATLQAATWSEYKKCNTEKFIVSVSPSCAISYISKGYGGRTTDTYIVENDGYLADLPHNCEVLADRGFKDLSFLLLRAKK